MKVQSATFKIRAYGQNFRVDFIPESVRIYATTEAMIEYANDDRQWKPCATHCEQLIQMAYGVTPTSQQAQRRAKETKPKLKICEAT